jgi:hypothetical protein
VFDCSNSIQADMFSKTTKAIARHVGKMYRYGNDVRLAIQNLIPTVMDVPKDLADTATNAQKRIWEKKIDEFVKRELYFEENMQTLYSLIWEQCSDVMQARVEALGDYDTMSKLGDLLALLKAIKPQAYNFQSQKNKANALHDAKRRLLMMCQDRHTTCPVYLDRFQNCVDVLEHCGGAIGPDPALVEQILKRDGNMTATAATDELAAAKEGAIEEYPTMVFLLGADRNRYGKLVEDLENAFTQGNDNYPRSVTGAYAMLTTWKQRNIIHVLGLGSEGVSFTNVEGGDSDDENNTKGEIALTNDGKKPVKRAGKAHITCFNCNEMGHYSNECTKERLTVKQHLMAGVADGEFEDDEFEFTFHQGANRRSVLLNQPSSAVPKDWILLDNQSTVDVFLQRPTVEEHPEGRLLHGYPLQCRGDEHEPRRRPARIRGGMVPLQWYREHPVACTSEGSTQGDFRQHRREPIRDPQERRHVEGVSRVAMRAVLPQHEDHVYDVGVYSSR